MIVSNEFHSHIDFRSMWNIIFILFRIILRKILEIVEINSNQLSIHNNNYNILSFWTSANRTHSLFRRIHFSCGTSIGPTIKWTPVNEGKSNGNNKIWLVCSLASNFGAFIHLMLVLIMSSDIESIDRWPLTTDHIQ